MAKKDENIENLQKAVAMELSAAHQYQLHAHVLEDWGMDLLAATMREEMQEELGHSDNFIERLMFLKSSPELKLDKPPQRAQTLKDMFEADLADERDAIKFYTQAARAAFDTGDVGTQALFTKIALDEEQHMAWLELQLDLLDRIGEKTYVAKHMSIGHEED